MSFALHGKTCTLVLFEQPGGEIRSLSLMKGMLDMSGEAVLLLHQEGGLAVRIPPHLVDDIEPVTDEHRECIGEIASEYCLRAFYDGRLKHGDDMISLRCLPGRPARRRRNNPRMQRTGRGAQ